MLDKLEKLLSSASGLDIRFHDVYSPGGDDQLSVWIGDVISGRNSEKTEQIFHWVHARDAGNAVQILVENQVKGEFDLCGRRAWTQAMVLDEIIMLWKRFQDTIGYSHSVESLANIASPAAVTYEGERRRPDLGPLHSALLSCGTDGWRPMIPMRVGIMECIASLYEQV
ncbi:MAG: hypothetical protein VX320_00895 [Candidatus Thermoplasmatota archaeon]|nr:hypothetical protein [Candidatus Thermoplasmatota archaeon]